MISSEIDMKELERSLLKTAAVFGEANETGISRWGVAVCRRLIGESRVKGTDSKPRKTQAKTMMSEANRVIVVVEKQAIVNRLSKGKDVFIIVNGKRQKFENSLILKTPPEVNAWIEEKRNGNGQVKRIQQDRKAIASLSVVRRAIAEKSKRIGKAKGGWVGAGQEIARFQKSGSRIAIGKNVSGYAHKWQSGGKGTMKKDTWNPEGTISNKFKHVATERVLKSSDMDKAIADAARNTITWYEKALNGRLK